MKHQAGGERRAAGDDRDGAHRGERGGSLLVGVETTAIVFVLTRCVRARLLDRRPRADGEHSEDEPDGKDDPGNFDGLKDLADAYRKENGLAAGTSIPADSVTRSASGLDPEISVAAANYQAARVARERKVPIDGVIKAIDRIKTEPRLGFLGEPTVNVLALNIALDQASAQ